MILDVLSRFRTKKNKMQKGMPLEPATVFSKGDLMEALRRHLIHWGTPLLILFGVTVGCILLRRMLDNIDVGLIFLLPIIYVGFRSDRSAALWTAAWSILSYNFVFSEMAIKGSFIDLTLITNAGIYLTVAWTVGGMANKIKKQFYMIRMRENRLSILYNISRGIIGAKSSSEVYLYAIHQMSEALGFNCAILEKIGNEMVMVANSNDHLQYFLSEWEKEAAAWTYNNRKISGKSTLQFNDRQGLYIALVTEKSCLGVLVIFERDLAILKNEANRNFLMAAANLISTAITRIEFAKAVEEATLLKESEKLHAAILNSISHDLHTPLTAIMGSVSSLIENRPIFSYEDEMELFETIDHEAQRMHRLVKNLLDMTKIESNTLKINYMWNDFGDIIALAERRFVKQYPDSKLKITKPEELPLANFDFALIEQVMTNLLDNAAKYSEPGKAIFFDVSPTKAHLVITVYNTCKSNKHLRSDKVFEKFYRSAEHTNVVGSGLGLSICKGFIEAHKGRIFIRLIGDKDVEINVRIPLDPTTKWSENNGSTNRSDHR